MENIGDCIILLILFMGIGGFWAVHEQKKWDFKIINALEQEKKELKAELAEFKKAKT